MSRFFRALVISAVATGVLAVALEARQNKLAAAKPKSLKAAPASPEVDADMLTGEQTELLMKEMEAEF